PKPESPAIIPAVRASHNSGNIQSSSRERFFIPSASVKFSGLLAIYLLLPSYDLSAKLLGAGEQSAYHSFTQRRLAFCWAFIYRAWMSRRILETAWKNNESAVDALRNAIS